MSGYESSPLTGKGSAVLNELPEYRGFGFGGYGFGFDGYGGDGYGSDDFFGGFGFGGGPAS